MCVVSSDDGNVSLGLTMFFSFLFTCTLCASVTYLVIIHYSCPDVYNVMYCTVLNCICILYPENL